MIFEKIIIIVHKTCLNFLYNLCVQHFSFEEELSAIWSQMDRGLHFIYSLFLRDSEKKLDFSL